MKQGAGARPVRTSCNFRRRIIVRTPRWYGGKPEFGQRTKNGFTDYESCSLLVMISIEKRDLVAWKTPEYFIRPLFFPAFAF